MIDLAIKEPGLYDIPNAAYHSQCCEKPSISSTGLRLIRSKSLAHFWGTSPLNPEGRPQPWTPSLSFGSAAHSLVLEGVLPEGQYALSPFDDFRTKEAKEWRDARLAEGLIIYTTHDLNTITDIAESLAQNALVKNGLLKGMVERSLFWFHPSAPGVMLKSRPDVIPHDTIGVDVKFVADASSRKALNSSLDYGYHIQAATVIDGIKAVFGRTIENYTLLCVEKTWPHVVVDYPLDASLINAGRTEYQAALKAFSEALQRTDWPGYPSKTLVLPEWKEKQLQAEFL